MSAVRLSPLNFSGLIATNRKLVVGSEEGLRSEQVTMWRYTACLDLYDDEEDVDSCCQPSVASGRALVCPVCAADGFNDHRDATDCCLWKDLPAPERWAIADAVEAGKTWLEACGLQQGAAS